MPSHGLWFHRSTASNMPDRPWLHQSAIDYFESLLEPDMRVLEHGSGGSTLWLAERVAEVVSVESDPRWQAAVQAKAPANAKVILWQEGGCAVGLDPMQPGGEFDLLYIDGADKDERKAYLKAAHELLKPGGIVVFDNANRPEYAAEREEFRQHATELARFENNLGYTKYFVTEFYRLDESENDDA